MTDEADSEQAVSPGAAQPAGDAAPGHALITGASAGLGFEFARQLARAGHPLVLVARDAERLGECARKLQQEFGVACETLSADLESEAGLAAVEHRLRQEGCGAVRVLVNNAGYGIRQGFTEGELAVELGQLAILVTAVLRLSRVALQVMPGRGGGSILNVSSVAALVSGGSYSAAKAWVVSFTRWASANHRRKGVTVTATCPGFVRTEFHERMGVDASRLPAIAWLQPEPVVRASLKAMRRGRPVVVPSLRYKLVLAATKLLPPAWLVSRGGLWR